MEVTDRGVMTSDGYFKDPITKIDLTGNEERILNNPETGKEYKFPYIMSSSGKPIPIAYRLWTKEEKKRQREAIGSRSSSSQSSNPKKDEELIALLDGLTTFLKDKLSDDDMAAVEDKLKVIRPKNKIDKMLDNISEEEKAYLKALLK